MGNLTNVAIKNAGPGRMQDGQGLFLDRTVSGGKWTYRYQFAGKRRDMGLGTWPSVSLADARKERDLWAAEIRAGRDPISVRRAQKEDAAALRDKQDPTFADMAQTAFEARRAKLRGGGARGRWFSPLATHVIPHIGKMRMSQIHQSDIRDALNPIWRKMHPTAEKAIQRTRMVFETAKLSGIDCDPFTVDAARHMLGEVNHTPRHHPALPWQEVPALYQELGDAPSSLCLRWIILTVVRAHAARGARLSEIDGNVWTVPADRVKGTEGRVRSFRVPLSTEAQEVIRIASEVTDGILFPSPSGASFITDQALNKKLRKMHVSATVHGFRTSFRSWVQDTDACSWEVAETILGHHIGGKVERSYARSDLLERRAPVMEAWARFVTGAESADVVPIRR